MFSPFPLVSDNVLLLRGVIEKNTGRHRGRGGDIEFPLDRLRWHREDMGRLIRGTFAPARAYSASMDKIAAEGVISEHSI